MGDEIKRIDLIKKIAVFKDFSWDSSVRDDSNKIAEFKKINILYGRNYSGKNDSITNIQISRNRFSFQTNILPPNSS